MTNRDGAPAAPASASRLAESLGDQLAAAESVPQEAMQLAAQVRDLVTATVLTDVAPATLTEVAGEVAALTRRLQARQRDHLHLVRHADGRLESLRQAGSGRLNPQAPPLQWVHRPIPPAPGSAVAPVEVEARCVFSAAHGGSPGRVHGGVLAVVLDEVTGAAIHASGATGMTVALNVSLRAGVPLDVPVTIVGRYTGGEGRKSFASAEVMVDGAAAATATAIYVSERR